MSAHTRGPVSLTPLRSLPVHGFHDPFTRRLLTHRGLTTELLEQRGQCMLRVRVVRQTLAEPLVGHRRLRGMLLLAPGSPALVRRTELVTPQGRVVSRNLVIGHLPQSPELCALATDHSVPLGRSLAVRGIPHRRRFLTAGLGVWNGSAGDVPAAARDYLMCLDGEAPLYVQETFHPAVAPPGRRTGTLVAAPARASLSGTTA
ncbi:hypothetical protein [Streptomyces pratensis]|uniref:hypothetical protein n=1 Tax=Streptomyces pratensis TaxID=1169025 RepID=UPI003017995B